MEEMRKEEVAYCICRTSETDRFMIGCDNCNEWYHGDCISITEEFAKRIQKFYCLMCRDKDPNLVIKIKEKKSTKKEKNESNLLIYNLSDTIKEEKPFGKYDPDYEPDIKKSKYIESEDEDIVPKPKGKRGRKLGTKLNKTSKKFKLQKFRKDNKPAKKNGKLKGSTRGRIKKVVHDENKRSHRKEEPEVDEGPRQCYGPGCVNIARKGSKYCSEECGMKLATNRIYEILPQRLRQWQSTPSAADEFSHKALENIKTEQMQAKRTLEQLDEKQRLLEDLITQSKLLPPIEDDANEKDDGDSELMTYCVTCGHEVAYRNAMRHMERCFNKYESQTSFGSAYKTKIEGVFCDVYNPHQKTFCKRLRVLCPEHSKDLRIGDEDVCGFPLVTNYFELTGQFCRAFKKKCMKHYCWEKFRRAEIDMGRVQQWLKMDDLFEKEQKIRFTMANRGGVLGLMLHQTIVHE